MIKERVQMLIKDFTTGFYNRTFYEIVLKKKFSRKMKKHTMAVIFGDFNFLKYSNELYGYQRVDEAICIISDVMNHVFEKNSTTHIMRFGGDEICIVMFDITEDRVKELIKKTKFAIEAIPCSVRKNLSIALGYSMSDNYERIETVIKCAQEAMKVDKASMQHEGTVDVSKAVEMLLPTIRRLIHENDYEAFKKILNERI